MNRVAAKLDEVIAKLDKVIANTATQAVEPATPITPPVVTPPVVDDPKKPKKFPHASKSVPNDKASKDGS